MTPLKVTKVAASVALILAISSPATAQSTRNVGGNVGNNNIGTNNIGGGGGGVNYGCLNVTLAGATSVRVCNQGYTARLGNIVCSGGVAQGRGTFYTLYQAPCNQAGQNFLGGTLSCQGTFCNWNPSQAGRAQGFRSESVAAYYN